MSRIHTIFAQRSSRHLKSCSGRTTVLRLAGSGIATIRMTFKTHAHADRSGAESASEAWKSRVIDCSTDAANLKTVRRLLWTQRRFTSIVGEACFSFC